MAPINLAALPKTKGAVPSNWNEAATRPRLTLPRADFGSANPAVKLLFLSLAVVIGLGSLQAEEKKPDAPPMQAIIAKTPEEKAKAEALISSYPLKTCLVSGDALGGMGETINTLYGERLIRFCCKGCVKSFNKNPDKYLPKLDAPEKPSS